MNSNRLIIFFLLLMASSCTTHSFDIVSTPSNADVLVFDEQKSIYVLAGKTPYNLNRDENVSKFIKGSNSLALIVQKKGYVVERMLLDQSLASNSSLTFNLKKIEDWAVAPVNSIKPIDIEIAVREVQNITKLVVAQDYDIAYSSVKSLIVKFPETPIFWEIKGSIEQLRNQKDDAIQSYKKSVALGGKSPETAEAIKILERSE